MPINKKGCLFDSLFLMVRPAGRAHLEVQQLLIKPEPQTECTLETENGKSNRIDELNR
jgi:hypothetical protein